MPSLSALYTLAVIAAVLAFLSRPRFAPDLVLLGGVMALLVAGVVSVSEALAGFSNAGVATVAVLYIVAAGMRETGAVERVSAVLLGNEASPRKAMLRLIPAVIALSAFLNNTPIVAALVPAIRDWSRRAQVSPSKLLLPLSYAAILGGTLTLIGTSTNLVVSGLVEASLEKVPGLHSIGMFELSWIGLPTALFGGAFMIVFAPWLLPDRRAAVGVDADPREYTVELEVRAGSPVVGQSIEAAGLRHLPGAFIIEIVRGERVIPAVGPEEVLQVGDRLVFAGVLESVVDLQRIEGLVPPNNQASKLQGPRSERRLVEAVVSFTNPLLGKTIREGNFRSTFGGVVVAVARHGERIKGKIGDIPLQAGDVLLVETSAPFVDRFQNRREFFLVRPVPDSTPRNHARAPWALAALAVMVGLAATELLSMLEAALVAAVALLLTGTLGLKEARRSVDSAVLTSIAAAFALGKAVQNSGLDQWIAGWVIHLGAENPHLSLALLYLATTLLTEFVTNNAAAVLAFPLGLSVAAQLGVSPMPFTMAVMMAASASFLTPIGYQTNLMVYGPGGYRLSDYLRMGGPISFVAFLVAITVIPLVWPFSS